MSTARTIALALYPKATRSGASWLTRCPLPSHGNGKGDRRPSLTVSDGETKPLFHCFGGCPSAAVAEEIRRRGLAEVEARDVSVQLAPKSNPDDRARTDKARAIWSESDAPPYSYLQARGINITSPPCIRWHRRLPYDGGTSFWPAMVAAVQGPDGKLQAVHRVFLSADGCAKAPVPKPKMALGPIRGGAVRLAPAGPALILVEGVEDALALIEMTGRPVWATVGTSGYANVVLPTEVSTVVLAPDGDPAGEKVVAGAAERFAAEGRKVLHLRPPPGSDWNDALVAWHERAGIREFDGGAPRDDAEAGAFADVLGWEVNHVAG